MEDKKQIFLLGGHDLEMLEIKNILIGHNILFYDKNLSWGAKLSEYKDEISSIPGEVTIYGIELIEDVAPPDNYLKIDHHNERSDEPASIEQVAALLEIELNRWQQLVAANDKGYIPAMKIMCATDKEIEQVRRADRRAQGVTIEDEQLAEESIKCHLSKQDGITIIKSLTDKFSPITDRMFGKANRLLVYTDTKLNYYGKEKERLVERFQDLIDERKAYHGGGNDGFFGVADNVFKNKVLKGKMLPEILKLLGNG